MKPEESSSLLPSAARIAKQSKNKQKTVTSLTTKETIRQAAFSEPELVLILQCHLACLTYFGDLGRASNYKTNAVEGSAASRAAEVRAIRRDVVARHCVLR